MKLFVVCLNILLISLVSWSCVQGTKKSQVPSPFGQMNADEVELGKMLYFDPRLSHDGTISCNSCHNVMNGGSDNRSVSMGINGKRGGRNSPTTFNAAFLSVQFWDGRAKNLEEQAKGPLTNPIEMGSKNHVLVIERIKKIPGYVNRFERVYGKEGLNIDNLAKAIAQYERTLITLNSPFDQYKAGDKKAMTAEQIEGWQTFQKVGCVACHGGDHFAGPKMPEGVGFFQKFPTFKDRSIERKYRFMKDKGRYEVTKNAADKHMFRVPTLRNIALTAPYFHNGAVRELDEAVRIMGKTQLNRKLSDAEVKQIVVFLNSLTGKLADQTMPTLPPTPGYAVGNID